MQLRYVFTMAFGALGLISNADGYLIDPESAMVEQAFRMANLAVIKTQGETMNDDAAWLLKQLFNVEGSAAKALVNKAFVPTIPNNKGERSGILVFEEEKMDIGPLKEDPNEVVIFCDLKRLGRKLKDPLHYWDNKAGQAVGMSDGCGSSFMYTQTFTGQFDVIQVCPWFLEYTVAKKYHTNADIKTLKAFLAVKGLDNLFAKFLYTEIDLLGLWDKAMLHEFMHTKPGGTKDDVKGFSGYGWKNCKGMAANDRGQTNADSYALFGSALFWFNEGHPIDENGKFRNEVPADASKRWVGSGAVRAVEAVQA